MKDIHHRYWFELSKRHGVVDNTGESVNTLIDALAERMPAVIDEVRQELPPALPTHLSKAIIGGLDTTTWQFERA